MAKNTLNLSTPENVWEYYCTIANGSGEMDEETSSWISQILANFSNEEIEAVIRDAAEDTQPYALFDVGFFKQTLKAIRLEKEMESLKSVDRTAANELNLLTRSVASIVAEQVKNATMNGLQEDFTNWVKATYGPTYVAPTIYTSPKGEPIKGVVNKAFDEIVMWVQLDEPLMLVGPAGSGKNHIMRQVADHLGYALLVVNSIQDPIDVLGYKSVTTGEYVPSQVVVFAEYCKEKDLIGIVEFSEMDAYDENGSIALNEPIAGKYMSLPSGKKLDLAHIRFVADANTYGTGATNEYVGRNQLDAATLNRYATVYVDYDPEVEKSLITHSVDKKEMIIEFIHDLRNAIRDCGLLHIISYRNLKQLEKALDYTDKSGKVSTEAIIRSAITKNLTKDDISNVVYHLNTNSPLVDAMRKLTY